MVSHLFSPLRLRGVTVPNRVVISPMCTYSAVDGMASDWHLAHLGKFALGGAGLVFVEATGVEARGRITHGCTGIWSDAHGDALAPIAAFLKAHGSIPAIQLGHAGRKASMQRPWFGNGPLTAEDHARGDEPWDIIAPSALPLANGWLTPKAMERSDIDDVIQAFADAALRADRAGFDVIELHGAHGYLLHSFVSPIANVRTDGYGGSRENRMRLPLEVTEAVRAVWPLDKPLFYRLSAVDGAKDGWDLDDSVVLAQALKARGVDVIDCSSGGISGGAAASATVPRGLGFQVPYAQRIRDEAEMLTQAVGLILDGPQAERILEEDSADLIAIAREALADPNWAHHAAADLGDSSGYDDWPDVYGWWLARREKLLAALSEA